MTLIEILFVVLLLNQIALAVGCFAIDAHSDKIEVKVVLLFLIPPMAVILVLLALYSAFRDDIRKAKDGKK